jgi:DNA polymerase III epsilon subunit-like protein
MPSLQPVAFDIETTGFEPDARLTVAGLATDAGCWQVLNNTGRPADAAELESRLSAHSDRSHSVEITTDDAGALHTLTELVDQQFDADRHYLCGFNGETWRSGFDLPFIRTACAQHEVQWPFHEFAYADVQSMTARFNTGDDSDLEAAYATLIGGEHADPFDKSREAVVAFEAGDWAELLRHNLADLRRTYELAVLAGRYVPKSDFEMKNLAPPDGGRP